MDFKVQSDWFCLNHHFKVTAFAFEWAFTMQTISTYPDNWERINGWDIAVIALVTYFINSLSISCYKSRLLLTSLFVLCVMFGFHWFALPQVPTTQLRKFLHGLRIGAHRGLALDAPENTIAAFKRSKSLGADSVEFDLEFTKEGIPVVLHDDTVDRTTDGVGSIRQMPFAEVQKLNAAAKFINKESFPHEKIPTLSDFIDLCLELDVKIFFDIKNFHPNLVPTITELFKKHEILYEKAAVCSFFPQVIYEIKRADAKIITGHIWRPSLISYFFSGQIKLADPNIITGHIWRPWFLTHRDYSRTQPYYSNPIVSTVMSWVDQFYIWNLHKWMWKVTGANLVLTEKHSISDEYIKMWRQRGLQVVAWTVNDYHEKLHYINILKCPFLTDRLSDMQEEIKGPDKFCRSKDDTPKPSGNL